MGMQNRTAKGTDSNKEETRRKQTQEPDVQNNDTGAMNMDITPGIHDHAAILSRMQSDEQRARLTLQLQRSYGNSYVQHILNTAGGPTEQIISRNTPLRPTAPPPGTQEQEQIETSNIPPAPAPPRAARPGSAQQSAAEQIESSNVQPVPPAPAMAPGTARPGSSQSSAAEQIESSNVQPVPPAPATAPGTAGPAAEQQVTPGTAAAPEVAGAAPGVAAPLSPAQSAIRAVWDSNVVESVRSVHTTLTGNEPDNEKARISLDHIRRAQDILLSTRPSYESNFETFSLFNYAASTLETLFGTIAPYNQEGVSLEYIADLIDPSREGSRFSIFTQVRDQL